jgi:hypothetical protein
MATAPMENALSNDDLKSLLESSPYHTAFKDRLYVYDSESRTIVGYMLKDSFDEEKTLSKKDKTAAEAFASIELQFKNKEDEKKFDYDAFVEAVIAELEVYLSYSSLTED